MDKIFVRCNRDGGAPRTFTLSPKEYTTADLRQMIKEGLSHEGPVKMYFPGSGIGKEIRDQDTLSDHFPNGMHGATINVDLESDSEDDGSDTTGDGLVNDLQIGDNVCDEEASQLNAIFGISEVRGRATKARVVGNKAHKSAIQSNAILSGIESFKLLVSTMKPKAQ